MGGTPFDGAGGGASEVGTESSYCTGARGWRLPLTQVSRLRRVGVGDYPFVHVFIESRRSLQRRLATLRVTEALILLNVTSTPAYDSAPPSCPEASSVAHLLAHAPHHSDASPRFVAAGFRVSTPSRPSARPLFDGFDGGGGHMYASAFQFRRDADIAQTSTVFSLAGRHGSG